jgi:hypothetical protein
MRAGCSADTPKEVPNPETILSTKQSSLLRFVQVIQPLAEVYKIPPTSLHVFYDLAGDMIAFNRAGSIFLNLRYFEAWRKFLFQSLGTSDDDCHER